MVRSSPRPIGSSRDDQAGVESRAAADGVAVCCRHSMVAEDVTAAASGRLTPSARRSLMAPTAGRCRCARIE